MITEETKYTIREISQKFNLPTSTLRYYEEIGILTNIERTPSGQRVYLQKHINRLKTICCFKGTGMSIAQLQKFFSYEENEDVNIDKIISLLESQKEMVEKQTLQLQKDFTHVQRKLRYYKAIKTAIKEHKPHPNWADYKNKVNYK